MAKGSLESVLNSEVVVKSPNTVVECAWRKPQELAM